MKELADEVGIRICDNLSKRIKWLQIMVFEIGRDNRKILVG